MQIWKPKCNAHEQLETYLLCVCVCGGGVGGGGVFGLIATTWLKPWNKVMGTRSKFVIKVAPGSQNFIWTRSNFGRTRSNFPKLKK